VEQQGIYFLASDSLYDLTVAFLNSLRLHNATVELCLIPYDNNIGRLLTLRARYGFGVFRDVETLAWCDQISCLFHGYTVGHYRKLAAWRGGFDRFLYIDADTVILRDLSFVFSFLEEYAFLTSHSNMPEITGWTWLASVFGCDCLTVRQKSFAANTGFIASRKDSLPVQSVAEGVQKALVCAKGHMRFPPIGEQRLINYLIVTSGYEYSSLSVLSYIYSRLGLARPIPTEFWAGKPGAIVRDGQLYRSDSDQPVLLVHWAGRWRPTPYDTWRARAEKLMGRTISGEGVTRVLPYRDLWDYYRNLGES